MVRLDTLLLKEGHCSPPSDAAALIMSGRVLVDDMVIDKAGTLVSPNSVLRIKQSLPYVSRGGAKLKGGPRWLGRRNRPDAR